MGDPPLVQSVAPAAWAELRVEDASPEGGNQGGCGGVVGFAPLLVSENKLNLQRGRANACFKPGGDLLRSPWPGLVLLLLFLLLVFLHLLLLVLFLVLLATLVSHGSPFQL
jgi:hypothetical protein